MARIRTIEPTDWKNQNEPWGGARCNIYVIQEGDGGAIKVGVAGHPARRMSALQSGNPRPLFLRAVFSGGPRDCCDVEEYVHRHFTARALGEWFYADLSKVTRVLQTFEGEAL